MSIINLQQQMQELSLLGMQNSIETDLAVAIKQDWSYEELMSKLLQSEKTYRDEQFISKKIKLAQFKKNAFLEDFDLTAKRGVSKQQVQDLMSLRWLEVARPIIFVGQTGMGKSYLAEALGRYACSRRKTVLFKEATELFIMIAEGRRLNKYLTTRRRLASYDVLIIDDFGMRKLSSTEAQDLKELLELRSLAKPTFFTTQLPVSHWGEVIEDAVILEAIIDLLEHSAIKIEMKGESYRKIKAKHLDSKASNN
ncbi:MAG: IS21-like element helper ATPase IstB [Pseudobdellovibrionaceae bacterium]